MTKSTFARGALAVALVLVLLLVLVVGYRALENEVDPATAAITPADAAQQAHPSYLYGRITVHDGVAYEGRLRWGRDQEAFWGDYFNGFKDQNPWAAHVPPARLLREPSPVRIFGMEVAKREVRIQLGRNFMARFGDIARIERLGSDVRCCRRTS